jgi:uncharacterized Zn finger protein
MIHITCPSCHKSIEHFILDQTVGAKYIDIEARCTNCNAVTITRYATSIIYQSTVTHKILEDNEHHIPNEH